MKLSTVQVDQVLTAIKAGKIVTVGYADGTITAIKRTACRHYKIKYDSYAWRRISLSMIKSLLSNNSRHEIKIGGVALNFKIKGNPCNTLWTVNKAIRTAQNALYCLLTKPLPLDCAYKRKALNRVRARIKELLQIKRRIMWSVA